jgi:multidrug efflux pump subunit AcrB
MTLGGLSLAIGILVGDATVEIENIHRNLGCGKPLTRAILDGAQQIAAPTFVSTLAICIVFVSVIVLRGPAKYLFNGAGARSRLAHSPHRSAHPESARRAAARHVRR